MFKPNKTTPALYGILMGFVSAIPFINFLNCFCAGIPAGECGIFTNSILCRCLATSGDCLAVGALAGLSEQLFHQFIRCISSILGNVIANDVWLAESYNLNIPGEMDKLHNLFDESFSVSSFLGVWLGQCSFIHCLDCSADYQGNLQPSHLKIWWEILYKPMEKPAPSSPMQSAETNDEIPLQYFIINVRIVVHSKSVLKKYPHIVSSLAHCFSIACAKADEITHSAHIKISIRKNLPSQIHSCCNCIRTSAIKFFFLKFFFREWRAPFPVRDGVVQFRDVDKDIRQLSFTM